MALAQLRAQDQAEPQRQVTRQDIMRERLIACLAQLERRLQESDLIRSEQLAAELKLLSQRLERLEKDHHDLLSQLRAKPVPSPVVDTPPVPRGEGPDNFLIRARLAARAALEGPRYLLPVFGLALLALAAGLALRAQTLPPAAGLHTTSLPASPDRLVQLAGKGNTAALTILGLKALEAPVKLGEAVRFLTLAADKGQAVAQYRLGTLYERGLGVAADPVKAAHWYELAAAQGNRKAMHNLAVFYASGLSGRKNLAEAARWFAKAAARGLSDSQFNLAVLYERGEGVPQSLLDAYKWYAVAAASGDSGSKSRMAVLETQLSASDKAAAGKSAASFRAMALDHDANVPPDVPMLTPVRQKPVRDASAAR